MDDFSAIFQVVAFSPWNTRFQDLSNNIAYTVEELPLATCHSIGRASDLAIPTGIVLEDLSDDALLLEIGGVEFLRAPLSVLALTGYRTGTLHSFDFNSLMSDIELVGLAHHDVKFKLESGRPFGLLLRKTWLGVVPSRNLRDGSSSPFQQISTCILSPTGLRINTDIAYEGYSKGYLLEVPDVSKLQRFQLSIHGKTRINYPRHLLDVCAHQLSSRHLWIPFNPILPPTPFNRTPASFVGGLNHGKLDKISFSVEFSEAPAESIKIHSFQLNQISTTSGRAALTEELTHLFDGSGVAYTPSYRPLPTHRSADPCPIMYEPFQPGDIYGECIECHHCFHQEGLRQALNMTHACPLCRIPWPNKTRWYRVPSAPTPS